MADFMIHRSAIHLEQTLHVLMREGQRDDVDTQITRIYEAPMQVCNEVLANIQTEENLDDIQKIKEKYWPYQRYLLTQLGEAFCETLCDDLQALK